MQLDELSTAHPLLIGTMTNHLSTDKSNAPVEILTKQHKVVVTCSDGFHQIEGVCVNIRGVARQNVILEMNVLGKDKEPEGTSVK